MSPASFNQGNRFHSTEPGQSVSPEAWSDAGTSDMASPEDQQANRKAWQTVDFPTLLPIEKIAGASSYLQNQAMDSSSTNSGISNPGNSDRETELLDLIKDLNECNDVLLAKVSQLEESLERSQTALQAEIERGTDADGGFPDRSVAHLVTELEQATQVSQQQQDLNRSLEAELTALKTDHSQLVIEHNTLLKNSSEQSQRLQQSDRSCRDLKARLQRQQRYTLQFKAALEKCLGVSSTAYAGSSVAQPAQPTAPEPPQPLSPQSLAEVSNKTDKIRPWEASPLLDPLDPRLTAILKGEGFSSQAATAKRSLTSPTPPSQGMNSSAPERLQVGHGETWYDLSQSAFHASTDASQPHETQSNVEPAEFLETKPPAGSQEPEASEKAVSPVKLSTPDDGQSYIPAMTNTGGGPAPLVNPLRSQKRLDSLAAIDLPSFPRLDQVAAPVAAYSSPPETDART